MSGSRIRVHGRMPMPLSIFFKDPYPFVHSVYNMTTIKSCTMKPSHVCARAVRVTNRQMKMKRLTAKRDEHLRKSADDVMGPSCGYTLPKTSGPAVPSPPYSATRREEDPVLFSPRCRHYNNMPTFSSPCTRPPPKPTFCCSCYSIIITVAWFIFLLARAPTA